MKFKLIESIDKNIIKHMDHLEDYVVLYGQSGIHKFIKDVSNIINYNQEGEKDFNISEKIDGAPALYFGLDGREGDYKGKLFVATKSIDNKSPKLNHSTEEIEKNHESEGLREKLTSALIYLSMLNLPENIVYHSDLLFTDEDKKVVPIDGKEYIVFKPNTIVYAVGLGTEIYNTVDEAKLGLVVHTVYEADYSGYQIELSQTNKSHINKLLDDAGDNSELFIIGADVGDISIDMDVDDLEIINNLLGGIENFKITDILQSDSIGRFVKQFLLQFINKQTEFDTGVFGNVLNIKEFLNNFSIFLNEKFEKQIQGKGKRGISNAKDKFQRIYDIIQSKEFIDIIEVFLKSVEVKKVILKYFETIDSKIGKTFFYNEDDGNYIGTKPEGFVLVDEGGVTKIVDRMDFSRRNRLYAKY